MLRVGTYLKKRVLRAGGHVGLLCGLLIGGAVHADGLPPPAPPEVAALTTLVDDLCLGYKLPGAGGGGFLYMVAKDPEAAARIKVILNANRRNANARFVDMTLSKGGLQISRS